MSNLEIIKKIDELTQKIEELEHNNIDFDKALYSVPEVTKMLGLTREAVYYMIKRGELPTIKLGTIKIRKCDLIKILHGDIE